MTFKEDMSEWAQVIAGLLVVAAAFIGAIFLASAAAILCARLEYAMLQWVFG